jgi:glycosyltransferase involved in cell wall biosynthesis
MFAGNIGAAQGMATVIQAAAKLKGHADIQWLIVGDGRARESLQRQIAELGLAQTVHLLGRRAPDEMPSLLASADVLLVSLISDPVFALTVPGKLQSYLACGKPIVAALEGEGKKVVEESGAGVVCRPDDAAALAQAVLTVYRMSDSQRALMGENGRTYCGANFDRSALLYQLEGWLSQVVERRGEGEYQPGLVGSGPSE